MARKPFDICEEQTGSDVVVQHVLWTKREHLAAMAMRALLTGLADPVDATPFHETYWGYIARDAFNMADAMLAHQHTETKDGEGD